VQSTLEQTDIVRSIVSINQVYSHNAEEVVHGKEVVVKAVALRDRCMQD
jgi:hypothetical protein